MRSFAQFGETMKYPILRLGVIGGGQLGRMLIAAARKLGVAVCVLDPDPEAACAGIADEFLVGALTDGEAIAELAGRCDLLTYEIEHLNVEVLETLAGRGVVVRPAPRVLAIIQDKLAQKRHLADHGVPVPEFFAPPPNDTAATVAAAAARLGFPCVCKARRGGYDGHGVTVCRDEAELERALERTAGGSAGRYLERFVTDVREPAVIVACSVDGDVEVYPPFEMMFHPERNVCDAVIVPAELPGDSAKRAAEIASAAVESFESPGLYAVELFLSPEGEVTVNEIAPRPHNSGHVTIESCLTSQFEQHLRAVCGLPLGSTKLLSPGAMVNLLAGAAADGPPAISGMAEALACRGVSLHLYGKRRARPGRKMGHITALADTAEHALSRARAAAEMIRIT